MTHKSLFIFMPWDAFLGTATFAITGDKVIPTPGLQCSPQFGWIYNQVSRVRLK
jgi:hypothetical protein